MSTFLSLKYCASLAIKFKKVEDSIDLQFLLNLHGLDIEKHLNKPEYRLFRILKKRFGYREIQAPHEELRKIQSKLNKYLQALYLIHKPKAVHGFIRKFEYNDEVYGIFSNASVHQGSKFVMNLDLTNFFPFISAKRVKAVVMQQPFELNDEISTLVTLLCTYNKKLPVGSPSSPVLANMVCYEMDLDLESYCEKNSIRYTRYADDMSFSSNQYFTQDQIDAIKEIIGVHDFFIHPKKFRLQSSKSRQTVTGLVVNEKVNVPRKEIRRLRAILHCCKTEGMFKAAHRYFNKGSISKYDLSNFRMKLEGKINFVGQIRGKEDQVYLKLYNQLAELVHTAG